MLIISFTSFYAAMTPILGVLSFFGILFFYLSEIVNQFFFIFFQTMVINRYGPPNKYSKEITTEFFYNFLFYNGIIYVIGTWIFCINSYEERNYNILIADLVVLMVMIFAFGIAKVFYRI
jgi:hypothetical protein